MKVVLRRDIGRVDEPGKYPWKKPYVVTRRVYPGWPERRDGGYFVAYWTHRVSRHFGFGVEAYRAAVAEMKRLKESREVETPDGYTAKRDELGIDARYF